MAEPAFAEQRQEHRQRVLKGAVALMDINASEVHCTIRNMHSRGAELRVAHGCHLPNDFLLYVPIDATAYRSNVRWRLRERIGVEFIAREPKPAWHYG